MTVKIVMGTALSGKTYFIKENFPESEILSVGEYQKRIMNEMDVPKYLPMHKHIEILQKANDQIKNDMVERLSQYKDVIMEHTLFKAMRRKEYLEAFRAVTNEPVDIYVMQPSDEQLQINIQSDESIRDRGIGWIKSEMRQIEIPNIAEGFAHVYVVNDSGIQDWSDRPVERKFVDKDATLNLLEKDLSLEENAKETSVFQEKRFLHICEVCGRTEKLTAEEAHNQGWDYPPMIGEFGVLSPRTCGDCAITETAYWAIVAEKKTTAQLSENQLQAVERIMQEPDILRVDE
jgi:predicted kinase